VNRDSLVDDGAVTAELANGGEVGQRAVGSELRAQQLHSGDAVSLAEGFERTEDRVLGGAIGTLGHRTPS
jgi:hypothetical protein